MGRFPSAVNEQIGHEFAASQQYVAIAVYYDTETLPQLAAHFYRPADEQRNHARMLVARGEGADGSRAQQLLSDAVATYRECGMNALAIRASQLLSGDSLLLVEDFLSRNAVGDQGAPEADAPAAAGGAL